MTRILAAFAIDRRRASTVGIYEKCTALVDAARRQGFAVDAYFADGTTLYEYAAAEDFAPAPRGLAAAYFRYAGFWRKLNIVLRVADYDVLWYRAHPASRAQLRLIAAAHALGCKVIVDLPTYPTTWEATGLNAYLHRLLSARLPVARVDRFVTLSPDSEIEGRPTIRVRNGVSSPVLRRPDEPPGGPYRIFGIGQWAYWHGVDRLLTALAAPELAGQYELCLAGVGPAVAQLRSRAADLGVAVTWLSALYGAARDERLSWAEVGIGTLATHRKGVYPDQSLKHRLYAAAGLPFIATVSDPTWEGSAAVLRLSADEAPLDPSELRDFFARARSCRSAWGEELRTRADGLTWDHSYAPLWSYLRSFGNSRA